jgi:hypothetical protein
MADIKFSGNHIHITGSISEEDVDYLITCPDTIRWIQFDQNKKTINDLILLNRFFEAKPHVYLRYVELGELQYTPNVQNVIFNRFQNYYFDDLKYLKHLNGVDFDVLSSKIDLSPLLKYKDTLTELSFQKDIDRKSESIISQLINLKKVGFISSKFTSFHFLKDLPIEHFFLYGSRTNNYADLAGLKKLKTFRLKTNRSWVNFDFLKELPNLVDISLEACSAIIKFPDLSHLQHLNEVIVMGTKLADISELVKLQNCKVYATSKVLIKNKTVFWVDNRPKK